MLKVLEMNFVHVKNLLTSYHFYLLFYFYLPDQSMSVHESRAML